MTWKQGDTVSLPVYIESGAGVPLVFANAAAFVAAGWAATWYNGATALVTQPTYTLSPIGSTGWHAIGFALPGVGVTHLRFIAPSSEVANPADYLLVSPIYDTDAINSNVTSLFTQNPVPVSVASVRTTTITSTEGRSFVESFTIDAALLRVLDTTSDVVYTWANLADIGGNPWRIYASARATDAASQLPSNPVTFSYSAEITSKTNRTIAIGFTSSVPAGAVVSASDGTIPSKSFLFDVYLMPPTGSTYASYKIPVLSGTHTIMRQQTA